MLWAETKARPDARHNIGNISRVGVRVYLDISNSNEYSDFKIDKIVAERDEDGKPIVVAKVRNTGKRALDLKGTLHLTDGPGALSAGPYPVTPGTTLPVGGSGDLTVVLDPLLPRGPWKAALLLESGQVKRRVTARLTVPEPGGTSAAAFIDPSGLTAWYSVGCAVILAGLAGTMIGVRRRRRSG